jgi:hypothetical protein
VTRLHRLLDGATETVLKSPHFILHTDLARDDAKRTLERMEVTLGFASRYWRRPPRGQIQCYVVKDLENWPDTALPHPLARVWIGGVGGATTSQTLDSGRLIHCKATVYAAPQVGIAEHEVIHAYCCQTFGDTGPDWYKEGMAELAAFYSSHAVGVRRPAEMLQTLRSTRPATVQEIVGAGRFTLGISQTLDSMLARKRMGRHVSLDEWTERDTETVRHARRVYQSSWALCHMLLHNPNYAARFRSLGESYLTKRSDSFEQLFSSMHNEVGFEYLFFLRHLDNGYRVDLCSWDWHTRFRMLDECSPLIARVKAARGYQASGVILLEGQRCQITTEGSWSTSANGPLVDVSGNAAGAGRLVGVMMRYFELSEPFEIGGSRSFVAPVSGRLYLRCHDAWNQLADNRGVLRVRLSTPQ